MNTSLPQVPALYPATIVHSRTEKLRRSFRYGTFMWLVDLDALPVLSRILRPLARFRSKDHSGDPGASLRSNIDRWLRTHGVDVTAGRVLMLTNAAVFGYAFNPITLYWCYHRDGTQACVVAEVHNTYGARHRYLLHPDADGRAEVPKELYVSPFFPVDGSYVMRVPAPGQRVDVSVQLFRGERLAFAATLTGRHQPATSSRLARLLLRYPMPTLRVIALIRMQGIKLWLRGLPVAQRPAGHAREEQR